MKRTAGASLLLSAVIPFLSPAALAQSAEPATSILFENVRIFDGKSDALSASMNVLIRGNRIEKISRDPIAADRATRTIPGDGRTLMPGLIDMHWHAMLVRQTVATLLAGDLGYLNLIAGAEARGTRSCAGSPRCATSAVRASASSAPSTRTSFPVRASTPPGPSSP